MSIEAILLGTAQDGGLPHAACTCRRCEAARKDPARARGIASLALVLPPVGELPRQVLLIDASPDIRTQLDALADVRDAPADRTDRTPVDGVLLTQAHIGHYLGLAFFGFEAVNTQGLATYCTPRMAEFLRRNGPWSQLVSLGNLDLRPTEPGTPVDLGAGVTATALSVPHRDELSDTVGYLLRGPHRSLLYVPDTDSWSRWPRPLPEVLAGVDLALLDGSFYSLDELPGRDLSTVPHPLITTTMDLLQPLVDAGRTQVYFTHFNHSNPALEPDSPARQAIEARGFHVLEDGQELAL